MIRLGIIGAGRMAHGHVEQFAAIPGCRITAIADPVAARAEALAGFAGATAVAGAEELFDLVDAVVIASPNQFHHEQVLAATAAGLHVFCEKPGGVSLAEARDIADAVQAAGVVGAVGYAVRTSAPVRTMHRLLADGRLGELTTVGSRRLWNMRPEQCPPWYSGMPGGHLLEISVHELDWMLALGGPVTSVHARAQDRGITGIDSLWFTLNFAGGAVGWHEGSWSTHLPMFFRTAEGTAAGTATDEWGGTLYLAEGGKDRTEVPLTDEFDARADFLRCIRDGQAPASDMRWNLTVMTVADAIMRSLSSGATEPVRAEAAARPAALWLDH